MCALAFGDDVEETADDLFHNLKLFVNGMEPIH